MKIVFKVLVFFCFVLKLTAQSIPPTMVTEIEGKSQPLELSKVNVEVRIFGFLAETQMMLTFFNPYDREIAGNLYFPLPEGATVCGYALDIKGVMVDGVVVEKSKGRVIFEEIVRRGIDPGLVELVKGNNFRTRVYPIPSKGTRTVAVHYITELEHKNKTDYFYLPLDFKKEVKDFSLRVEVVKADSKPVIKNKGPADLRFTRWRDSYVAEAALKDVKLEEDLVLTLPEVEKQKVYVEKDENGNFYFCIQDLIDKSKEQKNLNAAIPHHITILWDASGSMGKSDHKREIELLRSYFKGFQRKEIAVDLVFFRNSKSDPIKMKISGGNSEKLIHEIENTVYDGGTQLGAISPLEKEKIPDFYLLFTDGLSNFGQEETFGWKAPLYIFSESAWANHSLLRQMALLTGGTYFNLNKMEDRFILRSIGSPIYSFISVEAPKNSITETYPKAVPLEQGRFILTGKLLTKETKVLLNYGLPGKVRKKVMFVVAKDNISEGNLLRTFWAQKKIEELQIFPKRNARELIETGKEYGLVTSGTSLLVLDNLNQYIEYGIRPPKSLPELRSQYDSHMEKEKVKTKKSDKLEYVLKLWEKRIGWWNTDFSKALSRLKEKKTPRKREGPPGFIDPAPDLALTTLMERAEQAIGGIVKDEEGYPLPGVTVTLSNSNTGIVIRSVADEKGVFIFADIPAGSYKLSAELSGFQTTSIERIRFHNGDKLRFPVTLSLSTLDEEVTVMAEAAEVDLKRAVSEKAEDKGVPFRGPSISLKKWTPDTPYLRKLENIDDNMAFEVYVGLRKIYDQSPAFFLDCANFFFERGMKETGLQVLSNIAEIELENAALLRILGHRLSQLGYLDLAALIFEQTLRLRAEEPQSYRDLALILDRLNDTKRAIELLYQVVIKPWDERFPGIEVIALMEINNMIARADRSVIKEIDIDPRLMKLLDVDIRIVLTWDADLTDIDLWVIEPSGEKAFYSQPETESGGLVSEDFTNGYGPEEYLIKKAFPGVFKIMVNYFGSSSPELFGPVTLQVDIFTNYGRKNEDRKSITLRLIDRKEVISVGEIEFK